MAGKGVKICAHIYAEFFFFFFFENTVKQADVKTRLAQSRGTGGKKTHAHYPAGC